MNIDPTNPITILLYVVIALINGFLYILRSVLVIKSTKKQAATVNCIVYTFNAMVIKFISLSDIWIVLIVQGVTSWLGCYFAMTFYEKIIKPKRREQIREEQREQDLHK